jgi:predicted CDP-diglyceride synthetase/phosphatidate cytidylyltransferase
MCRVKYQHAIKNFYVKFYRSFRWIMTDYYDIVLALIPVSLAGLTALLVSLGMSVSVSIALASTVTLGLIAHAMFINGPTVTQTGSEVGADASADSARHDGNPQTNRLSVE